MGKSARDFFTEEESQRIVQAIASAEKRTSGEIRLHLEDKCDKPVLKRAEEIFAQYGMQKTAQRNGILFYVAVQSHDFAVAGDLGIHEKVQQQFWDDINRRVLYHFTKGEFAEGLCEGILLCGQQLQHFFPLQADDKNELSDEISYS
jgi:uncharacterized membrane protein